MDSLINSLKNQFLVSMEIRCKYVSKSIPNWAVRWIISLLHLFIDLISHICLISTLYFTNNLIISISLLSKAFVINSGGGWNPWLNIKSDIGTLLYSSVQFLNMCGIRSLNCGKSNSIHLLKISIATALLLVIIELIIDSQTQSMSK